MLRKPDILMCYQHLGRSQLMAARARRLEEEYVREPGWIHFRFLP